MIINPDTYARVLGLDPHHGFLLPSRADGKLGRVDPDLPVTWPVWDHPTRQILWTAYTGTLVGFLLTWTWPWLIGTGVVVAAMALVDLRARLRWKHLRRAYPTPYFKLN